MNDLNIVGIYNGHIKLFEKAQILKASVKETSTLMSHPIESGTIVTDHKIINPAEISFNMVIASADYKSIFASIQEAFKKSIFLTIQTKSGIYKNMVIENLPHEENPNNFNSLIVLLQLKKVFIIKVLKGAITTPKHKRDTTAKNSGTKDTTKTKTDSELLSLYKKFK